MDANNNNFNFLCFKDLQSILYTDKDKIICEEIELSYSLALFFVYTHAIKPGFLESRP